VDRDLLEEEPRRRLQHFLGAHRGEEAEGAEEDRLRVAGDARQEAQRLAHGEVAEPVRPLDPPRRGEPARELPEGPQPRGPQQAEALGAEPAQAQRHVDALTAVEIVDAHEGARRGTAGDAQLVEQPEEVLVAGAAEGGHGDVDLLPVARHEGVGVAAEPVILLEQRQLEVVPQEVAGGEPAHASPDDRDALAHPARAKQKRAAEPLSPRTRLGTALPVSPRHGPRKQRAG
jgi:hypothetical protein